MTKNYLISYAFGTSAGSGFGRAVVTIAGDRGISFANVQEFERTTKETIDALWVSVLAVSELPGDAP
jgi:hypothetical protein